MAHCAISRHIAVSREAVFQALTDFRNVPGRIRGIKRIEMLTDGPVGKGTRFKETRVMFKREATVEMEIVAFDPPNGYVLGCESCGCRYRSEFKLTPRGTGTDVEMTFEAQPLTLFAKIMGVLMRPMLKMCMKACEEDLDDMKASIEGSAPPGAAQPA